MFPLMPIPVLANNDIVNHLHLWQNKKLMQKPSFYRLSEIESKIRYFYIQVLEKNINLPL